MKRTVSFITALVLLCATTYTAYLLYDHLSYKRKSMEEAKNSLQGLTHKAAQEIDAILVDVVTTANSVASDLSSGKLGSDDAAIKQRISEVLGRSKYGYSSSVSFVPYAHSPGVRLYSHRFMKKDNELVYSRIESVYDYTSHDWFKLPVSQDKSQKGPRGVASQHLKRTQRGRKDPEGSRLNT